ncbi:MAG: amino acid racemase [Acutalibacter sp.]|nr:amino acid racemase [Acutalibacter sp.]
MKTLGIIGGLGPMATAYLLQLIIEMTDAKTDQEHLDVIVFDRPNVPDRTAHILDPQKPSPLPSMTATAKTLEQLGAGCLCAPCVTSHYFYRELADSVSVPFLNMVEETAKELKVAGKKHPGILATTGTVSTGLFQSAFEAQGLTAVLPDEQGQKLVMSLIYDDIKAGKPADPEKFREVSEALHQNGCDCIVLGCTELSLIKKAAGLGPEYLDALEVLSKRAVEVCGAPLKQEYKKLI